MFENGYDIVEYGYVLVESGYDMVECGFGMVEYRNARVGLIKIIAIFDILGILLTFW